MVRIPACHAGGRGFESRPLRHLFQTSAEMLRFFCIYDVIVVYNQRVPVTRNPAIYLETQPLDWVLSFKAKRFFFSGYEPRLIVTSELGVPTVLQLTQIKALADDTRCGK